MQSKRCLLGEDPYTLCGKDQPPWSHTPAATLMPSVGPCITLLNTAIVFGDTSIRVFACKPQAGFPERGSSGRAQIPNACMIYWIGMFARFLGRREMQYISNQSTRQWMDKTRQVVQSFYSFYCRKNRRFFLHRGGTLPSL